MPALAALAAALAGVERACEDLTGRAQHLVEAADVFRAGASELGAAGPAHAADGICRDAQGVLEEASAILSAARSLTIGSRPSDRTTQASRPVAFMPGVQDPDGTFDPEERSIAEALAARGASVSRRPEDGGRRVKNPDAVVRGHAADPGTVTEFKSLRRPSTTAVQRAVLTAGRQLAGHDGDLVIDGRPAGLSEHVARSGMRRAVGQARVHGQALLRRVFVILDGDVLIELKRE